MVLDEGRLAYFGPTEDYLDRMTLSTIDVQLKNGVANEGLATMGFQPGVAGWWSRTANRAEKLDLLARLSEDLEGQIVNLLVRDADAVQPEQRGEGDDVNQDH
jgi:hypothetical protein